MSLIQQGIKKEWAGTKAYRADYLSNPEGSIFDVDKFVKICSVAVEQLPDLPGTK